MFNKLWQRNRKHEPALSVLALTTIYADRELLQQICHAAGWKIYFARNLAEGLEYPAGIVLFDRDLTGVDWRDGIKQLAASPHPRRVILASFVVDDYLWDEVIHCGGYDVLPKPYRSQEVIHTIQFAWAGVTKSHPSAQRTE